ncbi:hypothetical protein CEUSTIGMA_g4886.t1 [Chlamydomonas eustigma]|uniref:Uncharacterized protein n=1 Tax=Chlamydomonas eustigma TaxID=1157962 RepID=A0A250X303_9CHLO|nr:hypothetical protein CEUSTIGMA_g4886.t1 [Chlamydomonas eustigma]|eukprot:GAX77441.1 hypothetical protein CEUSTIGMA_g4886.t1 [Chlamydomonas eustigma]
MLSDDVSMSHDADRARRAKSTSNVRMVEREVPLQWSKALLDALQAHFADMTGSGLAGSAWGVSSMYILPSDGWIQSLLKEASAVMDTLDGPSASHLVHALYLMGYRPPDEWLMEMCEHSLHNLGLKNLAAPDLVNLTSALAEFRFYPSEEWRKMLVSEAVYHPVGFTPEEASTLLAAICMFQEFPEEMWLRTCYTHILAGIEDLEPESMADILWSVGCLETFKLGREQEDRNFMPPKSWMKLLIQVSQPHIKIMGKVEIIKMVWAAAVLKLRPPPSWLLPLLQRIRAILSPSQQQQVLQGPSKSVGSNSSSSSSSQQAAGGVTDGSQQQLPDPFELLYLSRCCNILYRNLTERPVLPAEPKVSYRPPGFEMDYEESGGEPAEVADEYERLGGPPPELGLLVRDLYEAVEHVASTMDELPPEWRRINVRYPPYAMQQMMEAEDQDDQDDGSRAEDDYA